jgi:large subunit ribosomal protein L32
MAVPKRRLSRSRSRSRRARWVASTPELVPVPVAGTTVRIPRRLLAYYRRFPDALAELAGR